MQDIIKTIETDFERLNDSVANLLYTDVDLVDNIGQYIIDAGGKRIRPILVILCSKALGDVSDAAIKLATIIEYIHTATLLHDDVVDMSSMRRGRKTVNAEWGNAPAVLVGDFIYSRSFELLVKLERMEIMQLMAETTNRIAAGEVLQMAKAGDPTLDKATYFDIIGRKTAILFEAACRGAAILANASKETQDAMGTYGHNLGIGFQIIDDYLDYTGNTEEMGKNLGDDLAEGKTTLPLMLAMEQASETDASIIANALRNKDIDAIDQVGSIVRSTNALADTLAEAHIQINESIQALKSLDIPKDIERSLTAIADLAINRTA